MKKIVIIAPALLPIPAIKGGAVENLVNLLIDENECNHRLNLTIVTPYDSEAFEVAKKYVNTKFLWFKPRNMLAIHRNRIFKYIICPILRIDYYDDIKDQIINLLKKEHYDKIIMESNSEFINTLGRIFGKSNIICHIHIRPNLYNGIYKNCSKIIAVSQYIKNEIVNYSDTPSEKIVILKNGIDRNMFCPNINYRAITRKKYLISDDEVAICYVGRIVELKGVRDLIKAAYLLGDNKKFKIFIVGSLGGHFAQSDDTASPFAKEMLKLSANLGDKIVYTGYIDNSNLPQFLNGMDIAVMPSKYKEAAGVNNIEYQSVGLPIITTNMGGIPEYITSESACIINNDDSLANSLKEKLLFLINNDEERKRMSKSGIRNSRQYSKESFFNNFLDLL